MQKTALISYRFFLFVLVFPGFSPVCYKLKYSLRKIRLTACRVHVLFTLPNRYCFTDSSPHQPWHFGGRLSENFLNLPVCVLFKGTCHYSLTHTCLCEEIMDCVRVIVPFAQPCGHLKKRHIVRFGYMQPFCLPKHIGI